MVYTDVQLNTYLPVSPLPEVVHNSKRFLIMDWPVTLCGRKGFCVILNWVELFASFNNMVLRQDTSNCLILSIRTHDCLVGSVELGADGSGVGCCLEFVEGLSYCVSPCEGKIFCQVNEVVYFSTAVNDESTVIISKA